MSLTRFTDYKIEIELPPLPGMTGKRTAAVDSILVRLTGQQVLMEVPVSYVNEDGSPMTIPGLSGYSRSLCAGMDTIVNMNTGEILCDISEMEIEGVENPKLSGVRYGYQFEFMMKLMQQKSDVKDLALSYLQQAATAGKLD